NHFPDNRKLESPKTSTSINYQIKGHKGTFGLIPSFSRTFCGSCNRVRLTATGQLLLCLGNEYSVDLKQVVRRYPNEIEPLKAAIINAMHIKPERHYFDLDHEPQILRFMNTTGG
ncbi:MAG: GTP 3',8-cyclase MoaA, partial [Pseudomonadota bacterium]